MAFSAAAAACTAVYLTVLLNVTAAPHRHQVERNVGHLYYS